MISDRDLIVISTVNKRNDLTYVVSTSISHDKCPIVKGVTRGEIIVGGWVLTQINEKQQKAYILHVRTLNVVYLLYLKKMNRLSKDMSLKA